MEKKRGSRTLKYPILKNVEWCSITRNKKSVLEIEGKEIDNFTWRKFQIYVGEKIGAGRFYFTIKFKDNAELYTGLTKSVIMDLSIPAKDQDENLIQEVSNRFKNLEAKLNNASQAGGITYEMLLQSTKQGYETQVQFLNQQINYKNEIITELKQDIRDLGFELDECEDQNRELQQRSGYNQYLEPISKILLAKFGGGKPVKLAESDPAGIPSEILQVLGVIDYSKIKPEDLQKMINLLRQYITATDLPLKGQ